MLEGLLHHKKETKDYICALTISQDGVDAALWESGADGKTAILATSHARYETEWDKAIDAADDAISSVEEKLPEGFELKKVVFGLYPEWLSEDHIKEVYLKKLKQLTAALSLTPVGFVELPIAVSHLLTKDEGTQQTVILIALENKFVTVSLFKIGKLIGSRTIDRTEMVSADVEKALVSFTDVEVLPSRMLLFGSAADIEAVKANLLSYPWQKKANFLHFPKIEILAPEYAIKAVAIASATELMPHVEDQDEAVVSQPENKEVVAHPSTSTEVSAIAEDLGFADENIVEDELPQNNDTVETTSAETLENVSPVEVPSSKFRASLPAFKMPKLQMSFMVPSVPKIGIVIAIVVILLLLGAGGVSAMWMLPRATLTVLVQPQTFDKAEEIIIDTKISTIDPEKKSIPAKTTTVNMSGTSTITTTGQKTVGDKATGEVTIFNKTLNTKTFKSGTKLTSGKLGFTLTSDVTIASASESVGSLTYGSSKADITASSIGTASNLSVNSDFTFDGLPSTSYTARNDKPLSGGSSREVQVVTKEDQKNLKAQAVSELNAKVKEQLDGTLTGGETVLDGSQQQEVTKELYSKDAGEEATAVTLDLTVSMEVATYNAAELNTLVSQIIDASKPAGYSYGKDDVTVTFSEVEKQKNGTWTVRPRIQVKLTPDIDTSQFAKMIAGKSVAEAAELLKQNNLVAGAEIAVVAPFSFLKQKIPSNVANINVQVSSL